METPELMTPLTATDREEIRVLLPEGKAGIAPGELDGFLTAIGSAPSILTPSAWLPTIIGEFEFEAENDFSRFVGLVLRRYNELTQRMYDEDSPCPPTSMKMAEAKNWCSGYIHGVRQDSVWVNDREAVSRLFTIAALAGELDLLGKPDADGKIIEDLTPYLAEYLSELPETVSILDDYWKEYRSMAVGRSLPAMSTKQSRNDPCACDSGRKFKKCCGR